MKTSMPPRLVKRFAQGWVLVALLALAGCAATPEMAGLDPGLFGRQAGGQVAFDGQATLLADPAALQTMVVGERLSSLVQAQVPIGRIVHEAALAAFADAFRGGVQSIDRIGSEPAPRQSPIVTVRVVNYVYRDRLLYLIPLPLPGLPMIEKRQLDVQIVADLRLLDAAGIVLWSGVYDSGIQIYDPPPGPLSWARESRLDGLTPLTHQTAYRLMQRVARDVGEWQRNVRLRERAL